MEQIHFILSGYETGNVFFFKVLFTCIKYTLELLQMEVNGMHNHRTYCTNILAINRKACLPGHIEHYSSKALFKFTLETPTSVASFPSFLRVPLGKCKNTNNKVRCVFPSTVL